MFVLLMFGAVYAQTYEHLDSLKFGDYGTANDRDTVTITLYRDFQFIEIVLSDSASTLTDSVQVFYKDQNLDLLVPIGGYNTATKDWVDGTTYFVPGNGNIRSYLLLYGVYPDQIVLVYANSGAGRVTGRRMLFTVNGKMF